MLLIFVHVVYAIQLSQNMIVCQIMSDAVTDKAHQVWVQPLPFFLNSLSVNSSSKFFRGHLSHSILYVIHVESPFKIELIVTIVVHMFKM